MHCRRFVAPGLSRRDMLLRSGSGIWRAGSGVTLSLAGFRSLGRRRAGRVGPRPSLGRLKSAGAQAPALSGEGHERHLPVHGRRAVADGHVRPQASSRPRARPADQGQDAPDAVQQRRQRARLPLEISQLRRERHPGQRLVSPCRPVRGRPGDHPVDGLELLRAHHRQLLHAHRQRLAGPAEPRCLGQLRPGKRVPGPARLRGLERRFDPAGRYRLLQQRLLAGVVSGVDLQAGGRASRQHHADRADARPSAHRSSTCCARSTRECWAAWAVTTAWRRRSPTTSWPFACRRRSPSS